LLNNCKGTENGESGIQDLHPQGAQSVATFRHEMERWSEKVMQHEMETTIKAYQTEKKCWM
jgi:hypothetical protein